MDTKKKEYSHEQSDATSSELGLSENGKCFRYDVDKPTVITKQRLRSGAPCKHLQFSDRPTDPYYKLHSYCRRGASSSTENILHDLRLI